jgi:hypothetical protein
MMVRDSLQRIERSLELIDCAAQAAALGIARAVSNDVFKRRLDLTSAICYFEG